MKGLVVLLVLVIGVGISFGQTPGDNEESGKLIVTITDEDGNLVSLPSEPHVAPIVTNDSLSPPNSDLPAPIDLKINNVQYNE